MKVVPEIQIFLGFFWVIIAFLQAYINWGARVVFSYLFLIGGIGLLVDNFVALYKKLKNRSNPLHH
ncbi:hypothetical protein U9J35_17160 [Rossellomorea aquimaris]|nr:hypothetical protein [Rossellomorea aquimaris]WRP05631.1 hypothetical protein U9J35_17160 [Rossellomorea aquimaris]